MQYTEPVLVQTRLLAGRLFDWMENTCCVLLFDFKLEVDLARLDMRDFELRREMLELRHGVGDTGCPRSGAGCARLGPSKLGACSSG